MKIDHWKPQFNDLERNKRKEFGENFKKNRIENGFSIEEIAKILFISEDMVLRIERGIVSPDSPNLQEKLNRIQNRKSLIIS
ncbi:helix-turn-helix domain-containing protein [Peribacillus aracenensis]|uniref:helix-turn-helix domain-containing protein n=1 Tax=Peribacillus aracenensis TaxID=2976708 RepID=UPI0021A78FCA|nr:helix-turn-helix transcriptional regulator [Peribacillus sp. BBB004]